MYLTRKIKHRKNKENSKYVLDMDVFHLKLHLYIIKSNKDLCNKVSGILQGINFDDMGGCVDKQFIDGVSIMILKPDISNGDLTHECLHFMNTLYEHIGYEIQRENDELDCYLLGHLVDLVTDCIKSHKKHYKNN